MAFFQNMHIWGCDIFTRLVLIQATQTVFYISKIHDFDDTCFFFFSATKWNLKSGFFLFPWQVLLGKQIPSSKSCGLSIQLSLKKWSQTDKNYLRNDCSKGESPTPLIKTQTPTMGSKCSNDCFFDFCYHLRYIRVVWSV